MRSAAGRIGRVIDSARQSARPAALHESFLNYREFRFLKLATLAAVVAVSIYLGDGRYDSGYGGSWAGYTLGTAGALLILWLTWFGYRKRNYPEIRGPLAATLSAHVYFGLCLLLIATLHTGFHFGLNIHTLAYVLMCLVIGSGMVGVYCYARFPRVLTENRAGMSMQQMLSRIASLDDELRVAALPLDQKAAAAIERAAETTAIGGSVWQQLSGRSSECATTSALAHLETRPEISPELEATWLQLRVLLEEKALLLARARRDVRYKAIVEAWLYLHVPITFMLLAALFAHVLSIFFFW